MLANVNLNNDLNLLKPRTGRVVVVGNRGTVDINPRLIMIKETTVCGVMLSQSSDVKEDNCFSEYLIFFF